MNKKLISLFLVCLLILTAALLSSCKKEKEEKASGVSTGLKQQMKESEDFEDPSLKNEEDTAVLVNTPHPEEDYIGKWTATSDHAEWLYGNVNLKINEDHTWSGNITEESYTGRWTYTSEGVVIKDKKGYINWKLYFVADGSLVFEDIESPGSPIVLKKGTGKAVN